MKLFLRLKSKTSTLVFLTVFFINICFCLLYKFNFNKSNYEKILNSTDAFGYYEYLPWLIKNKNINYPNSYSYSVSNERYLKYTFGTALMQLPFYSTSYLCSYKNIDKYDISFIEIVFVYIGTSVYLALAFLFLWELLTLLNISHQSKIIALSLIYLATNLFNYTIMEPMMSHVYSFFSISGFLYAILTYSQTNNKKYEYLIYLFVFLVCAVRPINALILFSVFGTRFLFLKKYKIVALIFISCVLAIIIQFFLWYLQVHSLILNTYIGEGFYWTNPEIINVLFSFRKGLFLYAPILILSIIGFVFANYESNKQNKLYVILLIIVTYVISCWWYWCYGDSFGHRAFIDYYGVFVIGLAYFFERLKTPLHWMVFSSVSVFLVILNLIQTWQYHHDILPKEYMTFNKYKYLFFKMDENYKNTIGGINDMKPYGSNYVVYIDTIKDSNFSRYAPCIIKNKTKSHLIFLDISFTKNELIANQSKNLKLIVDIKDRALRTIASTDFLINETPCDYLSPNTKNYSYQLKVDSESDYNFIGLLISDYSEKKYLISNIVIKSYCYL